MPDLLTRAREWLEEVAGERSDDFIVRSVFTMQMSARPSTTEPLFSDRLLLVATAGAGYATIPETAILGSCDHVVGSDVRLLGDIEPAALKWACLDAALSMCPTSPSQTSTLIGPPEAKASRRAKQIANEALRLISPGSRILVIGAVASIIDALLADGFEVVACDLDPSLQGKFVSKCLIPIGGPEVTLDLIKTVKLIVATGMTIVNETFDDIISESKKTSGALIVYSQSCPSIAARAAFAYDIDAVITELWPNYFFPGPTQMEVFRGRQH